jgi:hypothetical protein
VAVHDELGRVPKTEEIEQVALHPRVRDQGVLGLPYRRQKQQVGQPAIF